MSSTLQYESKIKPPAQQPGLNWGELLGKLGPLIGLVFVVGLFSALSYDSFVTVRNVELMLRQTAVVGTAALGMTLIIILGGIDLSVGSAIALVTVTIASLLPGETSQHWNLHPAIAALGGLLAGACCGMALGSMVIGYVGRVFSFVFGALAFLWVRSRYGGNPAILYTVGPPIMIHFVLLSLAKLGWPPAQWGARPSSSRRSLPSECGSLNERSPQTTAPIG